MRRRKEEQVSDIETTSAPQTQAGPVPKAVVMDEEALSRALTRIATRFSRPTAARRTWPWWAS